MVLVFSYTAPFFAKHSSCHRSTCWYSVSINCNAPRKEISPFPSDPPTLTFVFSCLSCIKASSLPKASGDMSLVSVLALLWWHGGASHICCLYFRSHFLTLSSNSQILASCSAMIRLSMATNSPFYLCSSPQPSSPSCKSLIYITITNQPQSGTEHCPSFVPLHRVIAEVCWFLEF